MPICTMELKIQPREQYCDQTFRYYEPQLTKTLIKVPAFAPFALTPTMTVRNSNPQIKADVSHLDQKIVAVLQTERAPKKTEGFLFVYATSSTRSYLLPAN